MRVYVDTNVFIDYFAKRKDRFRDLGLMAYEFFRRMIKEENKIIFSDLLLKEVEFGAKEEEIESIIIWIGDNIIRVKTTSEDKLLAEKMSKKLRLPYSDCLHSVLARKVNADYLITRNVKDFPDLVPVVLPESL